MILNGAITESYGWAAVDSHGAASYLNPAVCRLVKATGARDVLDAGCGIGALCGDLADEGLNVFGMDGDREGIAIARSRYPKPKFEVGNFDAFSSSMFATSDGLFDCVVSTEVVEHLYAPHELARYAFDALRPGGTLIITTPYHGYLKNLALSLVNKWDFHHRPLWHGGHIKFWSAKDLGELLVAAGFKLSGFEGIGRVPYLWKSMVLIATKPGAS